MYADLSCITNVTMATCTCAVPAKDAHSYTCWFLGTATSTQLCTKNMIQLSQAPPCAPPAPSSSGACGPNITASNMAPGSVLVPCTTSVLEVKVPWGKGDLQIQCVDQSNGSLIGEVVLHNPAGELFPFIRRGLQKLMWEAKMKQMISLGHTIQNVSLSWDISKTTYHSL